MSQGSNLGFFIYSYELLIFYPPALLAPVCLASKCERAGKYSGQANLRIQIINFINYLDIRY